MSRAFKLPTCAVRSCKRCGACARRTAAAGMTAERAWKLFLLVPRLLLTRPHAVPPPGRLPQRSTSTDVGRRMRERACAQVRRSQLLWARQTLTSAPLAPGNAATLRHLSDPDKRPQSSRHPMPDDIAGFRASHPAELGEALSTAKRGSAAGLSAAAVEHYIACAARTGRRWTC